MKPDDFLEFSLPNLKVTVNKIGCPTGKSSYARYFYRNHRKLYITVKLVEHRF